MVVNVCFPCGLDACESYGILAIETVRGLAALGAGVNVIARGRIDHPNCPPDVNAIAHRPHAPADLSIFLGYATGIDKFPECTRTVPAINLSMWESSIPPVDWLAPMNDCSAVITPSAFCTDLFQTAGVTVPIHTISLGIDPLYKPIRRTEGRPLTFLAFMDRGARKGGLKAQQAFSMAFGDDPAYKLILKGRDGGRVPTFTNANIETVQQDMTPAQLYTLYQQCDVLINPNMGEGFGLIPREFASSGGIALATRWGGTADLIDAWGWGLPYELVKATWAGSTFAGQSLGEGASVPLLDLRDCLWEVALTREAMARQALDKAKVARALYTWSGYAQEVYSVCEGVSRDH